MTPAVRRLLLLSNSTDPEGGYLEWPRAELRDFLGALDGEVLFVPYAGVTMSWDAYAARVREALGAAGYRVASVHEAADPAAAVRRARAIVVGGGNTFHLLHHLYAHGLLDVIRDRVASGVPYVGWSAGSVVACPTIRTTNDMPIVEPPSLRALGLLPFQINAHYTDFHQPGFRGETRAQRLAEFAAANPGVPVLGLPEGTLLRVEGDDARVLGAPTSAACVPVFGGTVAEVGIDEPLGVLLR
ncbi:MAG: dipeptidase PepE [Gemmatimonadaceae bacterium]